MAYIKLLIILCAVVLQSCKAQTKKINGVSFVASPTKIDAKHVEPVVRVNANYAAIMPFGFIRNLKHPHVMYNTSGQWFGESPEGASQYIKTLQECGVKIMLKPQIWVWGGAFTGRIEMHNEADWQALEKSYSTFIIEYAQLAQTLKVDILCIGTELERFVMQRTQFWKQLIQNIKTIYKGKLTYAANWDEFKRVPFWNDLDYVGVDAYFPLNTDKTPTITACKEGWEVHKSTIEHVFQNTGKPILFTEFGYRSVDYTAKAPWQSDYAMTAVNLEGQLNATKALFETFWDEEWFAGGFVWKWFHNHNEVGGVNDSRFTPQNKPVEIYIKQQYATKR